MFIDTIAEPIQHCIQIDRPVRTDQTEAFCRSAHLCEQETCPLQGKFLGYDPRDLRPVANR